MSAGAADRHDLFEQLRNLTQHWNDHEDIPRSQQLACTAIGRKLNDAGGVALMRDAYYDAKGANPSVHVIQAYWDGVGEWRW